MTVIQSYDFFKYLFVKGRWPKLFVNQTISYSEKRGVHLPSEHQTSSSSASWYPWSTSQTSPEQTKQRLVSQVDIKNVILQCSDCWAKTSFKSLSFLLTSIMFLCPAKMASWWLIIIYFIPVSCHNYFIFVRFQSRLISFAINCHLVADVIVNACNATFQRRNSDSTLFHTPIYKWNSFQLSQICDILFEMLTLRLRAVFHPGPETDSSKFVQINIRSLATKSSPNFQIWNLEARDLTLPASLVT